MGRIVKKCVVCGKVLEVGRLILVCRECSRWPK